MMWYLLVAVLPLVAAKNFQPPYHYGKCPDPSGVADFNTTAWMGKWYIIYKYPNDPVISGSCPFTTDTLNGDVIDDTLWYVTDGVQYYNEGSASMRSDANNSSKFTYSQTTGNTIGEWPVTITATDYDNYAVVYICIYDETTNTYQDYVWIKSKTPTLEGDAMSAVEAYIKTTNLVDTSKLIKSNFSDEACSYTSTLDLTD